MREGEKREVEAAIVYIKRERKRPLLNQEPECPTRERDEVRKCHPTGPKRGQVTGEVEAKDRVTE